jgi:hypothetical protein
MPARSLARFAVVVPTTALAALVACGSSMATGADAKKTTDSGSGSVGTTFAGNANNLTFQHYDFPGGGADPTPDPDGCTSSVPAMGFSAAITASSGRTTTPSWLPPLRAPIRLQPPGKRALGPLATPCALSSTYEPEFGSGSQEASDNGSGSDYSEDLEWQGVLGGSGSSTQFMALQALAGGATNTPDWPTGFVTPLSNINLGTDTSDILFFIGTDLNGSGQAQTIYLGVTGSLNITQAGSD